MSRYDLTDFEWRVIEPLLPNKPRGVPRVDDRRVLNGIFKVLPPIGKRKRYPPLSLTILHARECGTPEGRPRWTGGSSPICR